MAEIVYMLCALTSLSCAILLLRGYLKTGAKLLLWSFLCFFFLTANNIILVIDLVMLPNTDFHGMFWRGLVGAVAGALFLFGLIWEAT